MTQEFFNAHIKPNQLLKLDGIRILWYIFIARSKWDFLESQWTVQRTVATFIAFIQFDSSPCKNLNTLDKHQLILGKVFFSLP